MKSSDPNGFTITELMVALVLMSLIFILTIGFYLSFLKTGSVSTRERLNRQHMSLLLNRLAREIQEGGYGVARFPQLAFYFDHANSTDSFYRTLYINYSRYIRNSIPIDPNSRFHTPYSMWPSLIFHTKPMNESDMVANQFSLPAATPVDQSDAGSSVGGIICYSPRSENRMYTSAQPLANHGSSKAVDPGTTLANPPSGLVSQFTVNSTPGQSFNFAPAILYTFATDTNPGAIMRNGKVLLGDINTLRIQDFQIRALYSDSDGVTPRWSPTDGDFTSFPARNLRYIEVKIMYTTPDPNSNALTLGRQTQNVKSITKTIWASPRTVVLSRH